MNFLAINAINIVTYRPPRTVLHEFDEILVKVEKIENGLDNPELIVAWSRDFNFHLIEWEERRAKYQYKYKYKSIKDGTSEKKRTKMGM